MQTCRHTGSVGGEPRWARCGRCHARSWWRRIAGLPLSTGPRRRLPPDSAEESRGSPRAPGPRLERASATSNSGPRRHRGSRRRRPSTAPVSDDRRHQRRRPSSRPIPGDGRPRPTSPLPRRRRPDRRDGRRRPPRCRGGETHARTVAAARLDHPRSPRLPSPGVQRAIAFAGGARQQPRSSSRIKVASAGSPSTGRSGATPCQARYLVLLEGRAGRGSGRSDRPRRHSHRGRRSRLQHRCGPGRSEFTSSGASRSDGSDRRRTARDPR